jgi:hypothetical protein
MPLNVVITSITEPPTPTGSGIGLYQKGMGGGGGTVSLSGEIDLHGEQPNVDITFALHPTVLAAGYRFDDPGFSAEYAGSSPFGSPKNNTGDTECTVTDKNEKATYKYTLHLVNVNTGRFVALDPLVINR